LLIIVKPGVSGLDYIRGLVEDNRLKTIIDRVFPLEKVVEAQEYSATGRTK